MKRVAVNGFGRIGTKLQRAFEEWRSIVDGSPRAARERFIWEAREAAPSAAHGVPGSTT